MMIAIWWIEKGLLYFYCWARTELKFDGFERYLSPFSVQNPFKRCYRIGSRISIILRSGPFQPDNGSSTNCCLQAMLFQAFDVANELNLCHSIGDLWWKCHREMKSWKVLAIFVIWTQISQWTICRHLTEVEQRTSSKLQYEWAIIQRAAQSVALLRRIFHARANDGVRYQNWIFVLSIIQQFSHIAIRRASSQRTKYAIQLWRAMQSHTEWRQSTQF